MKPERGVDYPHEAYDQHYYEVLADEADRASASHRWRMTWLGRLLDVQPADRVLDLGVGVGSISRHMAERGATVEGVDLAPEAIAVARRRCEGLPVRLTV
ncbi:MAG: class I SAM-dependent methyltransferase, partial [Planctomycetota bacterium]|nr:class I SAM-dependent methyltransferase [Planctomycetota bacterium]